MTPIDIYIWTTCPYCHQAIELLERKGLSINIVNMDGKETELQKLRQKTGQRTVPQIFIGNQFIGGFSELSALDQSGQLDILLASK